MLRELVAQHRNLLDQIHAPQRDREPILLCEAERKVRDVAHLRGHQERRGNHRDRDRELHEHEELPESEGLAAGARAAADRGGRPDRRQIHGGIEAGQEAYGRRDAEHPNEQRRLADEVERQRLAEQLRDRRRVEHDPGRDRADYERGQCEHERLGEELRRQSLLLAPRIFRSPTSFARFVARAVARLM